ncbi:hypothetical protein Q1695_006713 [Nippostrongylus brasiliensis]|nr:hypothetical protein Q1695_006713 [Nippostrongylus brasiliensis]
MQQLAVISSVLAACVAISVPEEHSEGGKVFHRLFVADRKLTLEELSDYLDAVQKHSDFVPEELQIIFNNLTSRTVADLLTFVNEVREGYLELPSEARQILDVAETRIPPLGERMNTALKMLLTKIGKISTSTKSSFHKYWTLFFESLAAPMSLRSTFLSALYADIVVTYRREGSTVQNETRRLSPQLHRLLRSDFAEDFARAAAKFSSNEIKVNEVANELNNF